MPATLVDIQKRYGMNVLPLYKDELHEPFMEVEKGWGYKGVLLYEVDSKGLICHECGKDTINLGNHSVQKHKISAREYRKKYGLNLNTPLTTREGSKSQIRHNRKGAKQAEFQKEASLKSINKRFWNPKENKGQLHWQSGVLYQGKNPIDMVKLRTKQKKARESLKNNGGHTVQRQNMTGSCEAQIHSRMEIVAQTVGNYNFTVEQMKEVDSSLYGVLQRRFGSFNKAKKYYNYETREVNIRMDDAKMIGQLRAYFIKNKRLPSYKDWNKTDFDHPREAYLREFGSWKRAIFEAGIQILSKDLKIALISD